MTIRSNSHACRMRTAAARTDLASLLGTGALVVAILFLAAERPAAAPATASSPSPVDLGTLGGTFARATHVSDSGIVAGFSALPGDAATHAFVWTHGRGMVDLGTLGGTLSFPTAVNNKGTVVGYSSLPGD